MSKPQSRPVYRRAQMLRLFEPSSIAIVGMSTRAGSFGERTFNNLTVNQPYGGRIHLVNAKYDKIGDRPCYPNLAALPESPDCVIVAVPREAAEPVVEECVKVGAGGVVLFASGYAEVGLPERAAQQARLAEIVRGTGTRLIGPNCLGFLNHWTRTAATFTASDFPTVVHPHAIGIVSQSGAMGFAFNQAVQRGVSVGQMLTAGNSCDIDIADEITYLAEDPRCKAIACLFEGMSNPERLLEAAEIAWARNVPIIMHKIATGQQGAQAAMSHTGSLAGSNAAYDAAFERAGIIRVPNHEGMIEAAAFFAKAPAPKAKGVAVAATSGGASIMSADAAEHHDVPLPQPEEKTLAVLREHIPEYGSVRNPCDVTAQVTSNQASILAVGNALMSDPNYGIVVMPFVQSYKESGGRNKVFSDIAADHDKMACNVWISEWHTGPGSREGEELPRIAIFRSMERCFSTLAAWHKREDKRKAGPRVLKRVSPPDAKDKAAKLIDAAKNKTLTEREAKEVLAAYGVPVVGEQLVQSLDACVAAANKLGYPIALKVESPDLPHKTEAGVIRLNLKSEADVRAGYEAVMANAHKVSPPPRINGVLVQPMIPPGTEIMVGARIDPMFGPLIVAGLGGILVELLKDTSVELAPINQGEARAMLGRLKAQSALTGFRGSEPVDQEKLADVIVRLAEFAADQQDRIAELDVNPLICAGTRIVAVDALIVRKD